MNCEIHRRKLARRELWRDNNSFKSEISNCFISVGSVSMDLCVKESDDAGKKDYEKRVHLKTNN